MTPVSERAGRAGELAIVVLVVVSALSSVAALLLFAVAGVPMPFTISFLSLPGMVLLATIGAWAGRTRRDVLLNRLAVGVQASAVGLVVYDGVRVGLQWALPLHFDALATIRGFGSLIAGRPPGSAAAAAAGWTYHVSNGVTFAIVYSILAGPARWWLGLVWGMVLEAGMLSVYPGVLHPSPAGSFVIDSVAGHAAFGAAVGWWCMRRALPGPLGERRG